MEKRAAFASLYPLVLSSHNTNDLTRYQWPSADAGDKHVIKMAEMARRMLFIDAPG